jgi:type IV pilus assembly protein PilY1
MGLPLAAMVSLLAGALARGATSTTLSLSQLPLDSRSQVRPNLMFVLDDSGSMDFEILLTNTNDGAVWWDSAGNGGTGSFVETLNGMQVPNFNCVGGQGSRSGTGPGAVTYYQDLATQSPICQPGTNTSSATNWLKYVYLFPNGIRTTNNGGYYNRTQTEAYTPASGAAGAYAISPPLPQLRNTNDAGFTQNGIYAAMRSADYNPIYYNPGKTYSPWQPYYNGTSTVSFSNASATSALSHPIYSPSSSTHDLTSTTAFYSQSSGWTFRFAPGMLLPVGQLNGSDVYGKCTVVSGTAGSVCSGATSSFARMATLTGLSSASYYTVAANEYWDVELAFYPAAYYQKLTSCAAIANAAARTGCAQPSACTAPTAVCYQAYDGNWLLETKITDSAGLQNFANWFQYYRKHTLLLASAMGNVLTPITTIRSGVAQMNHLPTSLTVYDLSSTSAASNVQALLAPIYTNPANGSTPTRPALNFIGQQYQNNSNIIQYACQANAAMVLTDGFAVADTSVTPPTYDAGKWMSESPFSTITAHSLADIAASYYTNNLNPTFTAGEVPVDASATAASADRNSNLHMVTYGFTLGTPGLIFGQSAYSAFNANPYGSWPAPFSDWPTPDLDRNPSGIDDLWHATINGRGQMFLASDAATATTAIQNMITNVLVKSGSFSAVTGSQVHSTTGTVVFRSSYNANAWFGDVVANPVSTAGVVDATTVDWSAAALLDAKAPSSRLIVTYDPSSATVYSFDSASLPSGVLSTLNSTSTSADAATVVNWIRGDRSSEGGTYRTRIHVLGDIVDAQPQYVQGASINGSTLSYSDNGYAAFKQQQGGAAPVLYQAANDGMLHAFDASVGGRTSGQELWAYVPSFVVPSLKNLAQKSYSHQFYVDATPTVGDVDLCNTLGNQCSPSWRRILVGGLAAGGHGFYALDVTNGATASTTSDVAQKFLWEFPNASTSSSVIAEIGNSFGRPIIAKTSAYGWVVLLTSGYFGSGDTATANGHLFVLNAYTGTLIADLATSGGPTLAQVSAAVTSASNLTISRVYGGDLEGNLWRFDLSGANTSSSPWTTRKITTLVDGSSNTQPVTAAPELGMVNGSLVVYVGTGRLLNTEDLSNTATNTFYAIMDDSRTMPINPLRSNLTAHTLRSSGGVVSIDSVNMDWASSRGWYVDASLTSGSGERFLSAAELIQGVIYVVSNAPSGAACSSASYIYAFDYLSGNELPGSRFPGSQAWLQQTIGASLGSFPTTMQITGGQLVGLVHRSDNTVDTVNLAAPPPNAFSKAGWLEVTH